MANTSVSDSPSPQQSASELVSGLIAGLEITIGQAPDTLSGQP